MSNKNKKLLGIVIAFLLSSLVMLGYSVIISLVGGFGTEFILACFRLADGWTFGVLLLAFLSLWQRYKEGGITARYITGLVFCALAILSFYTAITASTAKSVIASTVCAFLFGILAIAVPAVISYVQGGGNSPIDGTDYDEEAEKAKLNADWKKTQIKVAKANTEAKKQEIIEREMLFFPIDKKFENELDFTMPVLMNKTNIYTVKKASKAKGLFSEEQILKAKYSIKVFLGKEDK